MAWEKDLKAVKAAIEAMQPFVALKETVERLAQADYDLARLTQIDKEMVEKRAATAALDTAHAARIAALEQQYQQTKQTLETSLAPAREAIATVERAHADKLKTMGAKHAALEADITAMSAERNVLRGEIAALEAKKAEAEHALAAVRKVVGA